MEASNLILRKKAHALYKKHWNTLILMSFFLALIAMLPTCIILMFEHFGILKTAVKPIISFLCDVILYPVTITGTAHIYLAVWRGQTPKVSMLFQFCASVQLWLRTLFLGFLYQLILGFFTILEESRRLFSNNMVVFYGLSLLFGIGRVWIVVRLALLPYLYETEYTSKSPWITIRNAFLRMKGHSGHYMWFVITVSWLIVPILMITVIFFDIQTVILAGKIKLTSFMANQYRLLPTNKMKPHSTWNRRKTLYRKDNVRHVGNRLILIMCGAPHAAQGYCRKFGIIRPSWAILYE